MESSNKVTESTAGLTEEIKDFPFEELKTSASQQNRRTSLVKEI
jgi:hypothetical protein